MRTIANIAGRGWYGWLALALAVAATLVTWCYGFWKGPTTGLIFLPIGILVFFATIGALAMPLISSVLVIVAALTMVGKGTSAILVLAAQVFLGVGLVSFAWLFWKQKWRR
jgi:hypothetical protein